MDFLLALTAAVAAVGGTAISRLIDVWAARRAHVGPLVKEMDEARRELIETLEQTAQARADRIKTLEDELAAEREARAEEVEKLNKRVQRLETALTIALDRLHEAGQAIAVPLDEV